MIPAKNYEAVSKFVKVMPRILWPLSFRTRCSYWFPLCDRQHSKCLNYCYCFELRQPWRLRKYCLRMTWSYLLLSRSARQSSSTSIYSHRLIPLWRSTTSVSSPQCSKDRHCHRPTYKQFASLTAPCWFDGPRQVTTSTTTPSSTARSAAGCRWPTESTPTWRLTSGRRRHVVLTIISGCSASADTRETAYRATSLRSSSTVWNMISRCINCMCDYHVFNSW